MNKLELKHIAPYLPYQLKVIEVYNGKQVNDEFIVDCVNWNGGNIGGSDASLDSFELERAFNLRDIKPILRPMSDVIKDINGVVPAKELGRLAISVQKPNNLLVDSNGVPEVDYKIITKPFGEVLKVTNCDSWLVYLSLNEPLRCHYYIIEHLLKYHFDVFGLIEKGLAIKKESEAKDE